MGGLFSSNNVQPTVKDYYRPPQPINRNYNISRLQTESASIIDASIEALSSLSSPSTGNVPVSNRSGYLSNINTRSANSISRPPSLFSPKLPTPRLVKRNNNLFVNLIKTEIYNLNWEPMDLGTTTKLVNLVPHSAEYNKVSLKFYRYISNRMRGNFHITRIVKVQNPYLLAAFQIKKAEISTNFGHVNTLELFHGTKAINVPSIRNENFNWRLHGRSLGYRFGKGVSFSPKSFYSKHYCDKSNYVEKVMILAYVLVATSCNGNETTLLPPHGFDTTQKPNGDVIVKYEDNEFYPAYEIYFKEVNSAYNLHDDY